MGKAKEEERFLEQKDVDRQAKKATEEALDRKISDMTFIFSIYEGDN